MRRMSMSGLSIISGGQTGADRAALDWALANGIPHGGWCPLGRKAEDGVIDPKYHLQETPHSSYAERTEWNVRDSDATVIISLHRVLTGGSQKTLEFARKYQKPCLLIAKAASGERGGVLLQRFLEQHSVKRLNLAGPRASEEPEVGEYVRAVLDGCKAAGATGSPALPSLRTARLVLRPFGLEDAPALATLAGRKEIADTTASIPHPYSQEHAREWLSRHVDPAPPLKEVVLGITLAGQLIGAVGLRDINHEHCVAELGFWIGVPWWRQGYATEAASALVAYGFKALNLNRICAHHLVRNPASGRVLEKLGMKKEGLLRQRVRKWGLFENVVLLAVLRQEWRK